MNHDKAIRVLASVVVPGATVIGEIALPSTGHSQWSYHFRLLDLLNNPRLGFGANGSIGETIVFNEAKWIPAKGPTISITKQLHIRNEQIIELFEFDTNRPSEPLKYDPARFRNTQRLSVFTSNGMRIDGAFIGGVAFLASTAAKQFVAVSHATVQDVQKQDTFLNTPFVIIRRAAIIGFNSVDDA